MSDFMTFPVLTKDEKAEAIRKFWMDQGFNKDGSLGKEVYYEDVERFDAYFDAIVAGSLGPAVPEPPPPADTAARRDL